MLAHQYNPDTTLFCLSCGEYVSVLMYAAKLAEDEASMPLTWWYTPICLVVDLMGCLIRWTRSGGPNSRSVCKDSERASIAECSSSS